MQAVFLDTGSIDKGDIDFTLLEDIGVNWSYFENSSYDEVLARVKDAEIVVTSKVKIDRSIINRANKLKLICTASTGYDHIDLAGASLKNITVVNVANYSTLSVAQHALCLMLNLFTRAYSYANIIKKHGWKESLTPSVNNYSTQEIFNKTLGIIGYGNIGATFAKLANSLGMHVIVAKGMSEEPGRVDIEELLAVSDVVSLHVPLTPKTRNMITLNHLRKMKKSAFLVNCSRGSIVNEDDLATALEENIIAGAALDVLSEEPPVYNNRLLEIEDRNLIFTPHVAWATIESRSRLVQEIALNIKDFLNKQSRNVIIGRIN